MPTLRKSDMMSYEEIHKAAAHAEELPPFPTLPERLCYACLENLKQAFEEGRLEPSRVRAEKQDIRRAYAQECEAYRQYMAVYREYNDNSRKAGGIIRDILHGLEQDEPDYKKLFLLAMACIGKMKNDTVVPMLTNYKSPTG